MTDLSPLFTPYRLGRLELPNRFVMPAMQRGLCDNGNPTPALAAYYARRAQGGVSLIIGESAAVDHPTATRQTAALWIRQASRDAWARCADGQPLHEQLRLLHIRLSGRKLSLRRGHLGQRHREVIGAVAQVILADRPLIRDGFQPVQIILHLQLLGQRHIPLCLVHRYGRLGLDQLSLELAVV